MKRICLRCGEAMATTCWKCGKRYTRGPNPYGQRHQRLARQVVTQAEGCAYAGFGGCDGPLQADHIVPLSLGGTTERSNYQALCRRHNIGKGGANRVR